MKWIIPLLLLAAPSFSEPVKVTLDSSSQVAPNAAGYFTLSSVATLAGGDPQLRGKLAEVNVGRAPLAGETRLLTPGDLDLKLREAGYTPGRDAVVGGPAEAQITVSASAAPPSNSTPTAATAGQNQSAANTSTPVLVHPGDPVTIRVDDGLISVTAYGTAQSVGGVGDTIRVYRTGSPNALVATVIDAQDVELEP